MRILLEIFSRNDEILQIKRALQSLGHEVITIYEDSYRETCPYYQKKLDQIGVHTFRKRYEQEWIQRLHRMVEEFLPDAALFINLPTEMMKPSDLARIRARTKTICYFVDGISSNPDLYDYYALLDHIYVFEEQDVKYLKERRHIAAQYMPVGYNEAYAPICAVPMMDVIFIGSPFHHRLRLLERVSAAAARADWKLRIYGPFYDGRYPWKRLLFRRQYPYIMRYLMNGAVPPEEAARLYASSKICLNIHDVRHGSPNPRTFEILAVGAFELIDARVSYGGLLSPGEDLAVYEDAEDLMEKICYYLVHDDERRQIAVKGQCTTRPLSMKNILHAIMCGGTLKDIGA